jgi:hypothetical protein
VASTRESKAHQVRIEPVEYANGWAAIVEVDGVEVQDDSDADALCVTREEAIAHGERRAREFIRHQY